MTDPENTTSEPQATDWKSGLPDGFADLPYFKNAESPAAAINAIQNAAQYQGNSIRIPGEDAGADDVKAFQQKLLDRVPGLMPVPKADDTDAYTNAMRALGMPEEPEQYDVTGIDHAPDGEELGRLRKMAHDANMTTAQFRKWIAEESSLNYSAQEQMEYERGQALKELQGQWGVAYDDKVNVAIKAAEATKAPDYVLDMLKSNTMDAKGLKWLAELGDQLSTDAPQGAMQGKESAPKLTPAEAEARLGEVERRMFDRTTPKDQMPMLQEKRMKLMSQIVVD